MACDYSCPTLLDVMRDSYDPLLTPILITGAIFLFIWMVREHLMTMRVKK